MSLTVGSLFAGIGGFDFGLERAGMSVKWQVEIDPYCNRVLAKHWPSVPRYGDICAMDWATVQPVDLLCGGFPCQDISLCGNGAGLSGARSGLWREMVRAVRMVRPRYVIVENVAALRGRGLGEICGDLACSGYDTEWDCIPASIVGAPMRRERLYLVAQYQCERSAWGGFQPLERVAEFSWNQNVRGIKDLQGRSAIPQPLIRGTCDGIPDWMDRLHAIGNSIVPQIAEALGRMILRAEETA